MNIFWWTGEDTKLIIGHPADPMLCITVIYVTEKGIVSWAFLEKGFHD